MPDDLRLWLQRISLEQYAGIFAANDIDLDVLAELNDEDLKELGLSLGHRRRLLRAITAPEETPPAVAESGAGDVTEDIPSSPVLRDAERRQLTVLFCDLVGSTELSRRFDPEDLRELLGRYQDAVTAVVQRYGGYIANYLGDGVLAYFGWPHADEDDAAQAIRAGLGAVAAVRDLSLEAHVGIASGMVVIGDLEGVGGRQAGAVAGETPNLAARLEALAGPGQIVIGGLTRQLAGAAFILDDLGLQELKGIEEPVPAWQVLAERSVESRFDAREGRLTHFIGREHEVALLIERFERAAAGDGQAVLLSGEAGIGKSRIVETLHERLASIPHTRIRLQCSPFHTASALHPVIRHLEHAAGFRPGDEPDAKFDKLEALLRRGADDVTESTALLAPLLSLPATDRYRPIDLPAEQRNERTLRALVDQVFGLAAREPVLYVLEDAHWIDPTTRESVSRALERIEGARLMMLITHRPEFQSDWGRHPQVTALTLNRLSRGQGAEVVRSLGGDALDEEVVARILRRADGVPLFIEELTRSVIESPAAAGDSEIPETLQASLLARLDRLGGDAKEIAQLAAVIGREFGAELLGAVVGKPKETLDPVFRQLITSQILLSAGGAQGGVYAFRHAMMQDAAYQSLLLSRRRQYHGQIAQALENRFPDTAESQPELVAHHHTAAGAPEQAIPYWRRAGERALARYAFHEPLAHLERGLQLARGLPEGPTRSRHILHLLLLLGDARARASLFHEGLAAFREAAELARQSGSPIDLVRAALGFEVTELFQHGATPESVALLEAALAALGDGESIERCQVLSNLGRALFGIGSTERASELMRNATTLARRLDDRRALIDALLCEHITTTGRPWSEHQFPERRAALDEALAVAEEVGDPHRTTQVIHRRMPALLEMADLSGFEALLTRLGEMAEQRQYNDMWLLACTRALQAILHGDFAEAERLAETALETGREQQGEIATGVYGVQMFTIRREQGRLAEVAPLFRRFLDENPEDAAWRPGLAVIASDLGFSEPARQAFDNLAAAGFAFPIDAKRNLTLSYLAEVCTRVGDAGRAEQLYDLLLPYRDVAVVAPVATVCCGANARYLGMLASVLGDWPTAEEHFEAALAIDERLKAWPWLAHTQHEFAAALLARGKRGDRARAKDLLAAATETAERLGMPSLGQRIRSLRR